MEDKYTVHANFVDTSNVLYTVHANFVDTSNVLGFWPRMPLTLHRFALNNLLTP